MNKQYIVAGHRFELRMADDSAVWAHLSNYEPFEASDGGKPLFTLELVDASAMLKPDKEVVYNTPAEEPDQPRMEIYRNRAESRFKWVFEMAPVQKMNICVRMLCTEDFAEAQVAVADVNRLGAFGINNSMMLLYAFTTAPYDTLEMHSSVTRNDGKGYMFLGKSGTGKSTHSSLWLKYIPGSDLMNDDNPIIRIVDGVARVYGSPWSGKTPCYKNTDAPIGAIVKLNQYKENRIHRCQALEAYSIIFPSCSGLRSIERIADGLHATIEKLALEVPCFVLDCLPDEEAAQLCHKTVRS